MDTSGYLKKWLLDITLNENTELPDPESISDHDQIFLFYFLHWVMFRLAPVSIQNIEEPKRFLQVIRSYVNKLSAILSDKLRQVYINWIFTHIRPITHRLEKDFRVFPELGNLDTRYSSLLLYWALQQDKKEKSIQISENMIKLCIPDLEIELTPFVHILMNKAADDLQIIVSNDHISLCGIDVTVLAEEIFSQQEYVDMDGIVGEYSDNSPEYKKAFISYLSCLSRHPLEFKEVILKLLFYAVCSAIRDKKYGSLVTLLKLEKPTFKSDNPLSRILASFLNQSMVDKSLEMRVFQALNTKHTDDTMSIFLGVTQHDLEYFSNLPLPENPTLPEIMEEFKKWRKYSLRED